jgi:putative type I site-specific restriction-modification system, S subunit
MKSYSNYKDSGVKWLGQIPQHWEMLRAKNMFARMARPVREEDEVITCFRDGEVTLRKNRRTEGFTESFKEIGYQGIRKGDLVIHQMDAFAGAIGVSDSDGKGTPVYICLQPKIECNNVYYAHLLRVMAHSGFIKSLYRGIRERSSDFRFETLARLSLPLPPLSEQLSIVSYLDGKVSAMDRLVLLTQQKVEHLKALKQAIIQQTVTTGIPNKNHILKQTNIKWIKQIPQHWEMKKIRSLFSERKEKVSDKEWEALSVSKQGITPQLESAVKTDNGDNRKKVCCGDFVVNSRSDRKGSCGFSDYDGSVSLISIVLKPRNIIGKYYHYLLRSNDYIEEFYRNGRGIVADLWTTRYSEMKNIELPFPPLSEQEEMVAYLDEKTAKIDLLIDKELQQIDHIKDLKQMLIADVVTGKVDVTAKY